MDDKQQKLAKSFVMQKELYEFIKSDLLNFGTIDVDKPVQEIGARYVEREKLKEELKKKFNSYEFID